MPSSGALSMTPLANHSVVKRKARRIIARAFLLHRYRSRNVVGAVCAVVFAAVTAAPLKTGARIRTDKVISSELFY